MNRYLQGHQDFVRKVVGGRPDLFEKLAEGQAPDVLVVGCSDSRVIPELILDAEPGHLFVVRNIANLIPPLGDHNASVSAALHYGIDVLKVKHLVVMGHEACGGMAALGAWSRTGTGPGPGIEPWLKSAKSSWDELVFDGFHTREDWLRKLVEENVLQQLTNALTYPVVARAAEEGRLTLHACVYELGSGKLAFWDAASDRFVSGGAGAASGGRLTVDQVEKLNRVK